MKPFRRRILVTGATSGIGLALVKKIALRHEVMVAGRRPPSEASQILPEQSLYVHADCSEPENATKAIAEGLLQEGWTKLDNVIINAGTGYACTDGLDSVARIRETLDTNLTTPILLSRALFPWLERSRGTLTFIGSVAHKGQGLFPAYAASKGGLHGFARSLRSEWSGRATVQVLHPGPTRTDMHAKAGHDPGRLRSIFLNPDDVADMICEAAYGGRSPLKLSYMRMIGGANLMGRKL